MKVEHLLKKITLSQADMADIQEAVRKAEEKTSGEIALALTAESEKYSFWELIAATYLAAVVFIALLPFASKISEFYKNILWAFPVWMLPAFYGIVTLLTIFAGFWIFNIPAADRFIIPQQVRKDAVTKRAFRHFAESGIYDTENHSGILIFVSYLEKQVRIIADSGISKKVPQDLWNIIADTLAENIKNGKTKEGFIEAVEKCAELLSENFPASKDNPNELPDGLVILEA